MKSWVKFGLIWGFFMMLMINVSFPLLDGTGISAMKVVVSLPVWVVFGLIFGYVSRKKPVKGQTEKSERQ